ncbi:CE1 family esterase, partial [Corynebacterium nasicanis]
GFSHVAVGERSALLSLPAGYDPALSYPVLLVFGGLGASAEDMAATAGLHHGTNAIVAYARGLNNTWAGAPYSAASMGDDIAYARGIVDSIAAHHLVDRSRVYAVGHSNGGAFAEALACRAPDLVAGVASVSGMFYEGVDANCVGSPVPVLLMHAANDDVAVPVGGVRHGTRFEPTQEILGRWNHRNGCQPVPAPRWTSAPFAVATTGVGCRAETDFIISASAGHQWPSYASGEAWNFLSRQAR